MAKKVQPTKTSFKTSTKKFLGEITPSGTDPNFIKNINAKLFPKSK